MLPIPGTSSIAHFEENLGAIELELDQEELDALDSIGG
jgi:aryl-alcohol dehydrogenase-like predicted oxidoreductase